MNTLKLLRERFSTALASIASSESDLAGMVLPSGDAKFGDYQANCAMPLAKKLGRSPRDVAAEIIAKLDLAELCHGPEIAGPGFINLKLRDDWLVGQLKNVYADRERLGVERIPQPQTIVLDYSAPNVAKPMHVGHIRSTVIGDCLFRVLRFLGHRTIGDNHIGDWGTQFGMIIFGYKHFLDVEHYRDHPVAELSRLYRFVNQLVEWERLQAETLPQQRERLSQLRQQLEELPSPDADDPKAAKKQAKRQRQLIAQISDTEKEINAAEQRVTDIASDPACAAAIKEHSEFGQAALAETAKLHEGDAVNTSLWQEFLSPCLAEINETYSRLGVSFNHTLGESFYHDRLGSVVKDLEEKEIAVESDGAMCVFLEGQAAPMIVRKRDGAFLYATTDLATIQYRMETFDPNRILYVVDHRQSLHFEQLFATARRWGFDEVELTHISFGTVLGEDGKPFKTRSGSTVGLTGLLDEAVERAHKVVCENDDRLPKPRLSSDERRQVAERIGIGAIKYADLAHNRTSDYVFSYDKMLAMQGNTAAYMQYSYARVRSIFSRGGIDPQEAIPADFTPALDHPAERSLALQILRFSEALDRVMEDYRPNHLTGYLFELATRYSEFFEHCPVLKAEDETTKTSRLMLCDLTARTLQHGLSLLGIDVVERM